MCKLNFKLSYYRIHNISYVYQNIKIYFWHYCTALYECDLAPLHICSVLHLFYYSNMQTAHFPNRRSKMKNYIKKSIMSVDEIWARFGYKTGFCSRSTGRRACLGSACSFFLHTRVRFLLIGVVARRKPVVSAQRAAVMSIVMANICHVLSPTRILSVEN